MTPFQILSISILTVLFLRELLEIHRDTVLHRAHWLRALIWLAAGIAIALPGLVQSIAETVGINRGADLVVYLFVLAFLIVTFYFYSRQVRTQRQITQLTRIMAIKEAQRGRNGGE
jgi:small membrane protein